ncbi:MAG: hypothetical protein Q4F21_02270 [Lachnospiraceae bacterium]|nr:hypothetical protein [Lachnospiraceae bacterium]
MESQYYEHLVQCRPQPLMKLVKVISMVGFIFSLLMAPGALIAGIAGCLAMGATFWFSNREVGKEYEYVYIDGDISFDEIYNKSRRKTKLKTSWEETRLVCRADSPELNGYRQKNAKVQNFASRDKANESRVYALLTEKQGTYMIVYFEPAEDMLEMMWRKSPSKVKK